MSARPLRVLQVSRSVIQGGFDYHAEIARGFAERGADVCTVFLRGRMPAAREAVFPGRVVCLDANRRRRFKKSPWFALALWRASRGGPQHLAVCHHVTPARAVQLLLRLGRVKAAALVVHDSDYFDPSSRHGARRRRFLRRLMRFPWRVVGVSHAICGNVRAQVPTVPEARCRVIHNAIDADALERRMLPRAEARRTLGLGPDAFVFGTVGRLVGFKAHDDLVDAFSRAHGSMPGARLSIIGRGPLESRLRRQVDAAGLSERVVLHGFIDDAARYVAAFDAFVLPSHGEPFGLVLLEAMVARVPVLASDSGAPREILPSTEALFPAGDRRRLAERMIDLYAKPPSAREAIGQAGYEHARRAFSLEGYRAAYARLLDDAA